MKNGKVLLKETLNYFLCYLRTTGLIEHCMKRSAVFVLFLVLPDSGETQLSKVKYLMIFAEYSFPLIDYETREL